MSILIQSIGIKRMDLNRIVSVLLIIVFTLCISASATDQLSSLSSTFSVLQIPQPSFTHPPPQFRSSPIDVQFTYPLGFGIARPEITLQMLPTTISGCAFSFNNINASTPITIPIKFISSNSPSGASYINYIYSTKWTSWGHIIDNYTTCAIYSVQFRAYNQSTLIAESQVYTEQGTSNKWIENSDWVSYEQWSSSNIVEERAYNDIITNSIPPRLVDNTKINLSATNSNYRVYYIFMGSEGFFVPYVNGEIPNTALTLIPQYGPGEAQRCNSIESNTLSRIPGYTNMYSISLTINDIITSCQSNTNTSTWATQGFPHIRLQVLVITNTTWLSSIGSSIISLTIGIPSTSITKSTSSATNFITGTNTYNPAIPFTVPIVGNTYTTLFNIASDALAITGISLYKCSQYLADTMQTERVLIRQNAILLESNPTAGGTVNRNNPFIFTPLLSSQIIYKLARVSPTQARAISFYTSSCYQQVDGSLNITANIYEYDKLTSSSDNIALQPTNIVGGITLTRQTTDLLVSVYNINISPIYAVVNGNVYCDISYKLKGGNTIHSLADVLIGPVTLNSWDEPVDTAWDGTKYPVLFNTLFTSLLSNPNMPQGVTIERITSIRAKVVTTTNVSDVSLPYTANHICSQEWGYDCSSYTQQSQCILDNTLYSTTDSATGDEICVCKNEYTGNICQRLVACEDRYNTLKQCNNHGIINTTNGVCNTICTCEQSWTGDDCRRPTGCESVYNQLNQCYTHGIIELVGGACNLKCTCDEEWTGDDCRRQTLCEARFNTYQQCNGRGMVDIDQGECRDECTCYDPQTWTGERCHRPVACESIYNDLSHCHQGGWVQLAPGSTTQCQEECTCTNGQTTEDCAPLIPGCDAETEALLSCHGHGIVERDQDGNCQAFCTCTSEWVGETCNRPSICEDDYNTYDQCHGHGIVNAVSQTECSSKCSCDQGWEGQTCDKTRDCTLSETFYGTCPQGQQLYSIIDDDTGYCNTICICTNVTSVDNCHNNGIIIGLPDGTCETECKCNDGYYGPNCIHDIRCDELITVTDNCKNHGTIFYDDTTQQCNETCTCTDPDLWTGPTCSQNALCTQAATTLKCGSYGIVTISDDDSEKCNQSCTCLYGYTGSLCSTCNISCHRGQDNPRALCQDTYPTISPCLCAMNSIGRYCQYNEVHTDITIRNRILPHWLINYIDNNTTQSSIQLEQFIKIIQNSFYNLLGYDNDHIIIDNNNNNSDHNIITNISDSKNTSIYKKDVQIRVFSPKTALRYSNTKCYPNNTNEQEDDSGEESSTAPISKDIPSILSLRITARVGKSIATINKEGNSVYALWNELITQNKIVPQLNTIMNQFGIEKLGIDGCTAGSSDDSNDDDYNINPIDPDLDDEEGNNEESSNNTYYIGYNIMYLCSIIVLSISMITIF